MTQENKDAFDNQDQQLNDQLDEQLQETQDQQETVENSGQLDQQSDNQQAVEDVQQSELNNQDRPQQEQVDLETVSADSQPNEGCEIADAEDQSQNQIENEISQQLEDENASSSEAESENKSVESEPESDTVASEESEAVSETEAASEQTPELESDVSSETVPEQEPQEIEEQAVQTDAQEDSGEEQPVQADAKDNPDQEQAADEKVEFTYTDDSDDQEKDGSEEDDSDQGLQHVLPWSHGLKQEFEENEYPRPTMESVIESILFASDEPISANRLKNIAEISTTKQVKDTIKVLNEKYEQTNSAFKIEQIAGGYQMMTHKVYNHWLMKLIRVRTETKLTQAALETLAIISYKQPIIRAEVEAIRGVSSGEMIRRLMSQGLVKIAGRAEVLGRPIMYGTTKKFLEVFGLNSVKDLPKVEELKKPKA